MENVLEVPEISLATLAERIRTEHTAVSTALNQSLAHAMAAGDALIEAKEKVQHGQWLPWLKDNCAISDRTAQLYMRVAKNRAEIEKRQIRNDIADLNLNEAAAMLALSSDLRKLMNFTKQLEDVDDPEDVIKLCVENDVGVIATSGYDPFAGRSKDEQREWIAFITFLVKNGYSSEGAAGHVEWILQRPFQNVDEWLGDEGEKFRTQRCMGLIKIPATAVAEWRKFMAQREGQSVEDFENEGRLIEEQRSKDKAERDEKARARKARKKKAAA